ncbi:MAG: SDR family NAD(P)-dependent oxidoreductase [Candidatus Hermodarchaeota archaeon]
MKVGDELKNKVAIITGAAQGMGKAVAEKFAEEGALLILVDIKKEKLQEVALLLEEKEIEVKSYDCDVSDENQVHHLVETVLKSFGKIDILINCAGILYPTPFHEMSVKEWDKVLSVNLKGVFLFMREVYPHMKDRGDGRIVNFSSTAGLTVSTIGGAHYTASKHAVIGLTKAVAKEGGSYGVRVNAVCPGLIDTEMVREIIEEPKIKNYEQSFPISRLGNPEEVAELVLFLVSDRSTYITGASLNISGGDLLI